MKLHRVALIVFATAGLAACGGNDDYTSPPTANTNQVPSSAVATTSAYRQYVGSLQTSESATPVDINSVDKPPTSESETAASL